MRGAGVHFSPMQDHIDLPDLTAFSLPTWSGPGNVSAAFQSILGANDVESSLKAYHQLLYAIGNNHAGTYYSVALGILPAIESVFREGGLWSKHAVLEILIDLCTSFRPERGEELYQ